MSPSEGAQLQLPEIDFRGLSASNAADGAGHLWDAVRAQVMQALESHGCFQAIYDGVSQEVKDELFGRITPELFALPPETKVHGGGSKSSYQGYIDQLHTFGYESMRIDDAARVESVDEVARLMWPPDGNASFRDAVWTFAKHLKALEQIVHRMILQGLGVEKYAGSQMESMVYALRLAAYGPPKDREIALRSHVDPNMITIVCQHQVDGLEVQTRDGDWIHVPSAMQNSFNVMVGETFMAWSNGRLRPPVHRVRMRDESRQPQLKRYSMVFSSRLRDDSKVEAPEELVGEAHPRRFKSYNYGDYVRFRFSAERVNEVESLEAFCGLEA